MQQLLRETPQWWEHIAQLGEDGAELLTWALSDLSLHDSSRRAAAILLRLAGSRRAQDEGALPMEITLSQQEIADMAVMSRTSLGKILSGFLKRGWVETSYTRIRVCDSTSMRQFVDDLD
jgi:CRP-like cAMP-binding protein